MRFELLCECGHVLRTVSTPAGVPAERVIAAYERKAAQDLLTMRCPCGRVSTAARSQVCQRRGVCRQARLVLRGAGGTDGGRGVVSDLRGLHLAHERRGGRYDPPMPRKPVERASPPGTVVIHGPAGPVAVPPGRVEVVGGLLVDTRNGRPSVTPVSASDPPAKIPPNDRRPT